MGPTFLPKGGLQPAQRARVKQSLLSIMHVRECVCACVRVCVRACMRPINVSDNVQVNSCTAFWAVESERRARPTVHVRERARERATESLLGARMRERA